MRASLGTVMPEVAGSSGEPPDPEVFATEPRENLLFVLLNLGLRHRRMIVATTLCSGILLALVALLAPRTYTSTTSFVAQAGEAQMSRFAGLAAQFGVTVPVSDAGQSPRFYADLLTSREVVNTAVEARYGVHRGDGSAARADLIELYEIRGASHAERLEKARENLLDAIDVSTDDKTGLVALSVTTRWATLSQAVTRQLIEGVHAFDLESRQSQASAERRFVEERLVEAEEELGAAEDNLKAFLERNRRYERSPALRFDYERLQRRVILEQQVFTSLSEAYEQAKIEEVRNTPVITVVESPSLPAAPDSRNVPLHMLLGLMMGAVAAVTWVLGRDSLVRAGAQDPEEFQEFVELRRQVREEVRSTWTKVHRGIRRAG